MICFSLYKQESLNYIFSHSIIMIVQFFVPHVSIVLFQSYLNYYNQILLLLFHPNFNTKNLRGTRETSLTELGHFGTVCIANKFLKMSQITYAMQRICLKFLIYEGLCLTISAKVIRLSVKSIYDCTQRTKITQLEPE